MRATVVIPTRDRPASLRACLTAVRTQAGVSLEPIVVDDGSVARDEVAAVAAGLGALVVRLEGAGPSAARNAGAAAATCDLVLMLDDDCVPRPRWAAALAAVAAPDRVVGGAVVPPRGASAWLRASERIAGSAEAGGHFFRTLNLACDRRLLLRVPFDTAFPGAAGEDRDWCARAARAGATLVRAPTAVVEHRAALDGSAFARRQLRYGAAVHLLRRRGTHVPVSARALGSGLGRALGDDPAAAIAMAAALGLNAAGYIGEAVRRRG
jgi:GT2 family glycosyltransferase